MAAKAASATEIKATQQSIYLAARQTGLNDVQAKIIVAQATHESGNFGSNVYRTDNNPFGLKYPRLRDKKYIARPSLIIMKSEGATPYAHYDSLKNSINDLVLSWHKSNGTDWTKIQSPEIYAAWLKSRGYYGDSLQNYTAALKRNFLNVNWLKYTLPLGLIFFSIPLIFLIFTSKK